MAPKAEEKNWWDEFAYMTPDEQMWVMAEHGLPYTPPNQDFTYEDDNEFPLAGLAAMPEFTSKGALDPRDLSQVGKGYTVGKQAAGAYVDNALTMLGDAGAYDASAFTPTLEYGKEVTTPGRSRLDDLAAKGGWEGYVAKKMRDENMTSSQAIAAMEDFLSQIPEDDPDQPAEVKALRASLPRARAATGSDAVAASLLGSRGGAGAGAGEDFWAKYDYDRVFNVANELQNAVYEDEPVGWTDPATGKMYDVAPEEIKTPQMEFYDKYGIPYPTKSYTDPEYAEGMLNAEEGTTPEQRAAEAADYQRAYADIVQKNEAAQALLHGGQRAQEEELLKAWEAAQPTPPKPLATRPATTTVPGSAGTDFGVERGMGGDLLASRGTALPTTLPTTVMMPGRQLANPTPGTNPATGIGAGNTWAYTNDQGQMFNAPPNPQATNLPLLRTLANGMRGVVGQGTGAAPQPGMNQGFGILAPGQTAKDPLFSAFTAPAGSKTRQMKASDVDMKGRTKRAAETNKKAQAAWYAQRDAEAADPTLNDIKARAALYLMTKMGRTPRGDAIGSRQGRISQMGL